MMPGLKTFLTVTGIALATLKPAAARDGARDTPVYEAAYYGYAVHVRNTYAIGYNPEVKRDRRVMALFAVRGLCHRPEVLQERIVNSEVFGITSSFPDIIVMVRCS